MFDHFFKDPSFDFETRSLFGDIHYGAGDVGEMLAAVANITDGDATSWLAEWRALAERIQSVGDEAIKAGHQVRAEGGYLRAAVYFAASYVFVDGTDNAETQLTELFPVRPGPSTSRNSVFEKESERTITPPKTLVLPEWRNRAKRIQP